MSIYVLLRRARFSEAIWFVGRARARVVPNRRPWALRVGVPVHLHGHEPEEMIDGAVLGEEARLRRFLEPSTI